MPSFFGSKSKGKDKDKDKPLGKDSIIKQRPKYNIVNTFNNIYCETLNPVQLLSFFQVSFETVLSPKYIKENTASPKKI